MLLNYTNQVLAILKEMTNVFPKQRTGKKITDEPGHLKVFSDVIFKNFHFSSQHNFDSLYTTRSKSEYRSQMKLIFLNNEQ